MHHSQQSMSDETKGALDALFQQAGPTGKFPGGKLTPDDEGQIAIQVTIVKSAVVMNFGTKIASLGFSPAEARNMANLLRQYANKLEPRSGPHAKQ